jgi:hypothetical protein
MATSKDTSRLKGNRRRVRMRQCIVCRKLLDIKAFRVVEANLDGFAEACFQCEALELNELGRMTRPDRALELICARWAALPRVEEESDDE